MESSLLVLLVVLVLYIRTSEAQLSSFLISCGGGNSSFSFDGRTWIADLVTNQNFSLGASRGFVANSSAEADLGAVYGTARFFTEMVNYTFEVVQGTRYFTRLHFCPFEFEKYNVNETSFDVVANGVKLLSEFNVVEEISRKDSHLKSEIGRNSSFLLLVKEYVLVANSNSFVIEFSPSTKGSLGFVNAIEIIASVDNIFPSVNSNMSNRGIETMYRLNVGGGLIEGDLDSGFWRIWELDSSFMITANAGSEIQNTTNITYSTGNSPSVAPLLLYETARAMSNTEVSEKLFNMSWKFEVHPSFDYLVRFHFCEVEFQKPKQRIFRIFINNRTAADNFDIFVKAGGRNKAYYQDFLETISYRINTLWIQLGPDTAAGALGTDALLNGLEIFKLSRDGNLAYVEKFSLNSESHKNSNSLVVWIGIGSAFVLAVVGILGFLYCKNLRKRKKLVNTKVDPPRCRPLFMHSTTNNAKGKAESVYGSIHSVRAGKRFTLAEICTATNNFDDNLVIGVGGFGKVYKGTLVEDGTIVAIKRSNPNSEQGLAEFETEIEMLSKLRHRHLVSLIGFCDEKNEMVLVYEYMANGTLRSHLFGTENPPLTWKQRLDACIGAARGLHYLHTGAEQRIIHRDVKTTNILVDENFIAKMSDFGLSKTGPGWDHTHVSTAVKGSFGYLDPEYFRRQQLTDKSDVYSFGVVLFEVICARAVINPSLPKDQINLAEWAMRSQRERKLESIIDDRLRGNISPESLEKFGEIAEKCLADEGKNRPTMGEVLWHLEYVSQIHDALSSRGGVNNMPTNMNVNYVSSPSGQALEDLEARMKSEGQLQHM